MSNDELALRTVPDKGRLSDPFVFLLSRETTHDTPGIESREMGSNG